METMHEKSQAANKWLNEASSTMMEMYNKQANLVYGFYNNLFNSMGINKNWMPNMGFAKSYDGHEMVNPFFSAWGGLFKANHFMNMCTSQYQDMYKQMADLSGLWSSMVQKKYENAQHAWGESAEKMQAVVEKEWKLRNEIANTLFETYNKQLGVSAELNRKFMEELSTHFAAAFKRNEKFCSDVLKGTHAPAREEKDHEEPITVKKHTKAEPAHAHSHNNHHKH